MSKKKITTKKMKKTLKLLSILILFIFISSLIYYNNDVRNISIVFFIGIAILSFLLALIYLCRKKWRAKAKTAFGIMLSCVICALISGFVYIPNNPEKKAEKKVARFIKEYNKKNTENCLELIRIYEDSIGKYQYIAEAKLDTPNELGITDIILYIDVYGKANEKCLISSSGLDHYGFSNAEIEIMRLGGYFDHNRVTDRELWAASDENRAKYNIYYEGLRNIAAYKINQATNILKNGYDQGGYLTIDLTVKNSPIAFKDPYVLVILDDDMSKTKTFKTNTTIMKGENKHISLNLGRMDAESFKVKILANEVFSDEWMENYLLSMRNWTGNEFQGIYTDAELAKILLKSDRTNESAIKTCDLYFYIEQFNL